MRAILALMSYLSIIKSLENVHYACSTHNTHILRMTGDESFTEDVKGFFYVICFGDHVRFKWACVLQCGTLDVLQSGVCDSSWKIVVFSFLFTTCRLCKADTKRNCFAEETSLVEGNAISSWCEIHRFSQREVHLVLAAALWTRRRWKMANDSTAQKSKNQTDFW